MKFKFVGADEGILPGVGLVKPNDVVEMPADLVAGCDTSSWVKQPDETESPAGKENKQ
jgi:hypothetical protein